MSSPVLKQMHSSNDEYYGLACLVMMSFYKLFSAKIASVAWSSFYLFQIYHSAIVAGKPSEYGEPLQICTLVYTGNI